MSLGSWYRARRGWVKVAIVVPASLFAVAALYVVVRTVQFAAAEKDAGLFVPNSANVVLRIKDLESHLARIEGSVAWKVLQRRILKDPAIRPAINLGLQDGGLPTLDEIEDERNRDLYSTGLLLRAAGRDAVAALRVGDSWSRTQVVAITRLRWSDFLLAPFAVLVLKSEEVAGRSALRLQVGRTDLRIVVEGRLALVSNDPNLLAQALRRTGTASSGERPLAARVEFGTSPALLDVRRNLADSGALPQIRMDGVRALEVWVDLAGSTAQVDCAFEGAEPARDESAAPHALARLAPPHATGVFVSASGIQDLFDGIRRRTRSAREDAILSSNARMALEALDEVGFSSRFLPKFDSGMVLITGAVERESRVYPGVAFILPSKDPEGAVEALNAVIKERARGMADSFFGSIPLGNFVIWSFQWPHSLQFNDFLRPCYAAVPGAFVFGNSLPFVEEILRGIGDEGSSGIVPARRLREAGIAVDPLLAGGTFLLPAIRESLEGPIPRLAQYLVESIKPDAVIRVEVMRDLREQGRTLPEDQVDDLVKKRRQNHIGEEERELRGSLHAMDFMKWLAFSLHPGPKGVTLHVALEFR